MSGTRSGGLEAAKTNKAKYGDDFYSRIGATGGKNGHTGGFAYGDNGKKFGRAGGYMSRRSRRIKRGERLRNDEYNELVPLAIRALGTLRLNGIIAVDVEQKNHVTVYERVSKHDWEYIFSDCGVGPAIEVAWIAVLGNELAQYKEKVSSSMATGNKLTEEESNRYRIIRNLAAALEVATGQKVR